MKIVIFQRVLTRYRLELFKELAEHPDVEWVRVIATDGERRGAQQGIPAGSHGRLSIEIVPCFRMKWRGVRRDTFVPFYPAAFKRMSGSDVVLVEGTTNVLNNLFIVPRARFEGRKVIWWDAGCSEPERILSRRLKDLLLRHLIGLTHAQMAYSTAAALYMTMHMNARACAVNVNTIATGFFESRRPLYRVAASSLAERKDNLIRLLYVGAVEKRKNLRELAVMLAEYNQRVRPIRLRIIGDGDDRDSLRTFRDERGLSFIEFLDPTYDFEKLERHYLDSDIFVMPGEGGLAIIQAMQFGVPVITGRADGTELDYIDDGVNGHLIDSTADLLMHVDAYARLEPTGRAAMHHRALDKAERINSSNWIERFIEIARNA